MFLTNVEAAAIDAQIARVEARLSVQVVAAVTGKSDTYVELPWKAFALGATLAASGVVLADLGWPQWVMAQTLLLHTVAILGTGAASALLVVFSPPIARLFLRRARRDLEVHQHAQVMFLTRELFRTQTRTGILIFVSLFERKIEVLPDIGFRDRVTDADWATVVARMTPRLREVRPFHALQDGLGALEALLASKGFQSHAGGGLPRADQLADRPVEERGPTSS